MSKILVGNKCDLDDERKVSTEAAQEFADTYNMKYYEASAKTTHNVDAFMEEIIEQVYATKFAGKADEPRSTFTLNSNEERFDGGT